MAGHVCQSIRDGRYLDVVCSICGVVARGVRSRSDAVDIEVSHERAYRGVSDDG